MRFSGFLRTKTGIAVAAFVIWLALPARCAPRRRHVCESTLIVEYFPDASENYGSGLPARRAEASGLPVRRRPASEAFDASLDSSLAYPDAFDWESRGFRSRSQSKSVYGAPSPDRSAPYRKGITPMNYRRSIASNYRTPSPDPSAPHRDVFTRATAAPCSTVRQILGQPALIDSPEH